MHGMRAFLKCSISITINKFVKLTFIFILILHHKISLFIRKRIKHLTLVQKYVILSFTTRCIWWDTAISIGPHCLVSHFPKYFKRVHVISTSEHSTYDYLKYQHMSTIQQFSIQDKKPSLQYSLVTKPDYERWHFILILPYTP